MRACFLNVHCKNGSTGSKLHWHVTMMSNVLGQTDWHPHRGPLTIYTSWLVGFLWQSGLVIFLPEKNISVLRNCHFNEEKSYIALKKTTNVAQALLDGIFIRPLHMEWN